MKVLVTGGAGFIGSHLALRLLQDGFQVTVLDNLLLGRREHLKPCEAFSKFRFVQLDLLELDRILSEFEGVQCVFHLAANSDILAGTKSTDRDLKLGTLATYNVCEASRRQGVREIVFASTSAIYGEAQIRPTPESYGPLLPISLYGASKLACEGLITAFSHNFGIKAWIFRFANIVGSQATHGAIYDFVHRLEKDPRVLNVLGNGTQKKSYLHVSDCVDGIVFGYKNSRKDLQVYNLASEGYTEVRSIAEEVARVFGQKRSCVPEVKYGSEDRGWTGDVPFTWLDGRELLKLGWKAHSTSSEAVTRAVPEVVDEILSGRYR